MAAQQNPPNSNNQTSQTVSVTTTQTIDLTIETGVNGGKTTGNE